MHAYLRVMITGGISGSKCAVDPEVAVDEDSTEDEEDELVSLERGSSLSERTG